MKKKISLVVSGESSLQEITSANSLIEPFKRTSSRLHELTSNKKY